MTQPPAQPDSQSSAQPQSQQPAQPYWQQPPGQGHAALQHGQQFQAPPQFGQPYPPQYPSTQPPKKNKALKIILILLGAVLLLCVGTIAIVALTTSGRQSFKDGYDSGRSGTTLGSISLQGTAH